MSLKAPQNNLFVQVESEYNDEYTTKDGKKIYLTTDQFTSDDELDNSNYKPTMIRRHYGTVVGLPIKLTEDIKIIQIDPGLPAPGAYLPNEQVDKMNKYVDSWACLNSFVYQWKTCADFEMEVEEGDKVYFHHNTITEDNEVGEVEGKKTFRLEYQNAICVVRTKKAIAAPSGREVSWEEIIPIAGHILVEPLWQDGVEDLGNGIKGIVTKSGIISELHEKPEPLRGNIVFAGKPMKGEDQELFPGDKIIYLPHSDYNVEIEGKTYYVMKYWEIIAKFD